MVISNPSQPHNKVTILFYSNFLHVTVNQIIIRINLQSMSDKDASCFFLNNNLISKSSVFQCKSSIHK